MPVEQAERIVNTLTDRTLMMREVEITLENAVTELCRKEQITITLELKP